MRPPLLIRTHADWGLPKVARLEGVQLGRERASNIGKTELVGKVKECKTVKTAS